MANSVNFIDGLDGLAAGVVAIAAGAFFVYSHQLTVVGNISASNAGPLIAVVAVGVCLGFLPHNFYPARIFMGDAGAMLLGVLVAASTLAVVGQDSYEFSGRTYFFFAPILIPFFILGIPLLDTAFAIIRRAGQRTSPAVADLNHLHHRLMRLGHGHRPAVLILWAWTALLSGAVLWPGITNSHNEIPPIAVGALSILLYTLFAPRGRTSLASSDNQSDEGRADSSRNGGRHAATPLSGPTARSQAAARARATAGTNAASSTSSADNDIPTSVSLNVPSVTATSSSTSAASTASASTASASTASANTSSANTSSASASPVSASPVSAGAGATPGNAMAFDATALGTAALGAAALGTAALGAAALGAGSVDPTVPMVMSPSDRLPKGGLPKAAAVGPPSGGTGQGARAGDRDAGSPLAEATPPMGLRFMRAPKT